MASGYSSRHPVTTYTETVRCVLCREVCCTVSLFGGVPIGGSTVDVLALNSKEWACSGLTWPDPILPCNGDSMSGCARLGLYTCTTTTSA